ncbi:lactococcin 972 family bacteriocin [Streptomyces rimosus]|uniref:lactococcin 972 family bacteriocin n=1 Tax=Streptomyces rimosus TaxID=1927 RepID=UPI00131BE166|nr:lactococcin 972 family bacteriocin [Streptomyces rimosus]
MPIRRNLKKMRSGRLALGVVSAAVMAGALVASSPAVAATDPAAPQIQVHTASEGEVPPAALIGPNGEKPVRWGVATFEAGSGPLTKVSKGGGTWNYGTTADGGYKKCYSNYIRPTKKHSAGVAIGSKTDKDIKGPDIWAKAAKTNGWAYKCSAYWGVY